MAGVIILEKIKSTEKMVRQIEIDNVLVFVVDRAVNKREIKEEVEKLFDVKVAKVRTHTLKNKKHAFVKFKPEYPAVDIATKLGLM
ncbi:MAG: 50S ribosomal protein L23 [Nanoarchaeota archaeon]|nr:50S ribosomal protein L23 [Nanoarchaeota archaeon]